MSHLVYEEHEPLTGITNQVWYEPGTEANNGKLHFKKIQDVDYILQMNQVQRSMNGASAGYQDSNGIHQVARIPTTLIEQWMREGFNWFESTDAERKRKLNNPEYKKLKVREGRL